MREKKKGLLLFLAVTFGVCWITVLVAYFCGLRYGDANFSTLMTVLMILPGAAMLLARKLSGESLELEEMGIVPHFRGNIKRYLFAYLFPTLATVLGGLLFFLVFPGQYDPAANELIDSLVGGEVTREAAESFLYSQVLLAILAGPLVNILISFTEVLGFQGYLLPQLKNCLGEKPGLKAAVACGAIWGAWYFPFLAEGYLYGKEHPGAPFLGMLLGLVFFTLFGTVLSYLTFRTGSIFPAVLAKSGIGAVAAMPLYFMTGESLLVVGPSAYSAFGCLAMLVFALLYALRIHRMEKAGTLYYQKNEGLSR